MKQQLLVEEYNRLADKVGAKKIKYFHNNIQAMEQLQQMKDQAEVKHVHDVAQHNEQVAILIRIMCRKMSLDKQVSEIMVQSAEMHDIGKNFIDPEVLHKPAKLDEQEWAQMKMHTLYGYDQALQKGLTNKILLDGILYHHERWDGKGYPKGLEGDQIPLVARMIAIADAYYAMCEQRDYKDAKTPEVAAQIIMANFGSQFDAKLKPAFEKCMPEWQGVILDLKREAAA